MWCTAQHVLGPLNRRHAKMNFICQCHVFCRIDQWSVKSAPLTSYSHVITISTADESNVLDRRVLKSASSGAKVVKNELFKSFSRQTAARCFCLARVLFHFTRDRPSLLNSTGVTITETKWQTHTSTCSTVAGIWRSLKMSTSFYKRLVSCSVSLLLRRHPPPPTITIDVYFGILCLLWTPAQRKRASMLYFANVYLFIYFLWPPYSPAMVNGSSRKFYAWWTLSVIREVTTWIFLVILKLQGGPKSDEIWRIFRPHPQTFCSHAQMRQNIVILKKTLVKHRWLLYM